MARPSVALLGLGFAGSRLHLPALQRLGADVVLAADPDPATHARAAGVATTTDWRAALASPARAVVVATPPATHAELALAVLDSGRHLLLEKPMTVSPAEASAVASAAAAGDRILQVGFAYRFHPLWKKVRGLVERRRLRPPLRFTARFTREGPDPVLDLAPHHVDLASWLLGTPPVRATATGPGRIELAWADGSVLDGTYAPGTAEDRVTIAASGRRVEVDRLRGRRLRGDAGLRGGAPPPELALWRTLRPEWERSFLAAMRSFLAAVTGERPMTGAGADAGAAAVRVSDALLRSRVSGRPEIVLAA